MTVTASVTAANKEYDRTNTASITNCSLTGVAAGDVANVTCTAGGPNTFSDATAANGKTVTATGISLGGSAAFKYQLSSTTATTTANITAKPASVTPTAASKVYGAADPAFTGTLSGFLAADGVTATYSRTAGESVAGGPYTISATLGPAGILGNYSITYNTALFTITAKPASVTPAAASKVYGAADPAFTGTLSGFLAADGVTASYSRTAGETVAGGPYTISATLGPAGILGNYSITYNTASFTITREAGVGDADRGEQDLRRGRPGLHGNAEWVPGGGRGDGELQPDGGRDGGRRPVHDQRDAEPGGGAEQLQHHLQHGHLHDHAEGGVGDADRGEQDLRRRPTRRFTGTLSGFLAADGVTASYSRTAGETVAGRPYTISATLSPAGGAGQLQHHVQHGHLHDHGEAGVGDAGRGEQGLRRGRPGASRGR